MSEVEIIGLIRFSFLGLEGRGSNGFAIKHETTEEKRTWLYEQSRLEFRLKLFEIVTLPSLLKQSLQDFKLIMLLGEDFPTWALERLQKMISGTTIIIEQKPVMGILDAVRECFEKHFSIDCDKRVSFRLDDDDAISLGWIERVHEIAQNLNWDDHEAENFVVFMERGLILHNVEEHVQVGGNILPVILHNPWSVGTVLISRRSSQINAYSKVHMVLRKHFPSHPVAAPHVLLRVFHGQNNTIQDFRERDIEKFINLKKQQWVTEAIINFHEIFGIELDKILEFLEIDEEQFLEKLYS